MALARLLFLLVFTCGLAPHAGFRLKRNKSSPASGSLHLQEEEQGSAAQLDDVTDEVAEEMEEEDDSDVLEEVEDEDDEIEEGEDSSSLVDSSTLVDRDSTDVSSQGAPARRRRSTTTTRRRRTSARRRRTIVGGGVSVSGSAWKALRYSFRVSPNGLNYIDFARQIFTSTSKDIDVLTVERVETDERITEGSEEKAMSVATDLGVKGNYGVFAASAQTQISRMNKNEVQTVEVEKIVRAQKYKLSAKSMSLSNKLTTSARDALKTWTFKRIVDEIGEFYATEMSLGGEFRTTHVMEKRVADSKNSLTWELDASYSDTLVSSVSGSSTGSITEDTTKSGTKMRTIWRVWGGSSTIWLKLTKDNRAKIQQKWANSVTDKNLYPLKVQLQPIWNLLKPLNTTKADKLKKYLETKWSKDAKNLPSYPAAGYVEALASRRKRGLEGTFDVARYACWHTANYHAGNWRGNPYADDARKDKENRDVAVIEAKKNLRGSSRLTGFIDQISEMATNFGWHVTNKLKGDPWGNMAKHQRNYEGNSREAKKLLGRSDLYTQIFGMVEEMCWATAHTRHWGRDQTFGKAYAYRDGMHKVLNDLMQQQKWPLYSR